MIHEVIWDINKQIDPWHFRAKTKERGEADVTLLQEAGSPPDDLWASFCYENNVC